jgi:hypothetical protein
MNQKTSLYNYLIDNKNNPDLEILKCEIDQRIYYYGDQFKSPYKHKNTTDYKFILRLIRSLIRTQNFVKGNPNIISNAYFNLENELTSIGYNVFSPPWDISSKRFLAFEFDTLIKLKKVNDQLSDYSLRHLISPEFNSKLQIIKNILKKYFEKNKIKAFIVPNDIAPLSRLSIDLCKELKIPSFIFLHGIPGRYNAIDENRTDFLLVWGEEIKKNYIKNGFSPNKVIVVGHPIYREVKNQNITFNLDDVLIISKSMNGGQHGDDVILTDRGNLILYLYRVEEVLKAMGVKKARVRLHPSENEEWYQENIDTEFYTFDHLSLKDSLKRSSVVIGPTSTVFLDAMYCGTNYVIFEPLVNGTDLINYPIVAPFDGSDKRIVASHSEKELEYVLKNKVIHDISFFKDYVSTPFDISILKNIIH